MSENPFRSESSISVRTPAPDVYFLAGYGRAASIAEGGEWMLLDALDGALQVPLIVRTLPDGTKDAISPTFSGVYASPSLSSAQIQEAWSETTDRLRQCGVISVVLRGSPLVPQAFDLPRLRPISSGRPTIVLDLTDEESAWSRMEGRCRTWTRKAVKHGYVGEVRQATGQDLVSTSDFRRLYEETMRRRSAQSVYFLGDDYYTELLEGLGSNLFIGQVRGQGGVVVSSTLLMRHAQRLHYHLSGSSVDSRMGANNLMLWTATQFAIAQGLDQFHLGAGVGVHDSLFKFKRSFGGRELEYDVSGLIVDDERYQAQVENRARACGTTADALRASHFFPAYRAGTAHA